MEVCELVAVVAFGDDEWECPFNHEKKPSFEGKNVMPPVDGKAKNDADTLGWNLEAQYARRETIDVEVTVGSRSGSHAVRYTPHHLIPGNESWPETKLLKWVDSEKGTIHTDIGYDVNNASNGVDLPGIHGIGDTAWSAKSPNFQKGYAFAAMAASRPMRQFHDRHPAYSSFVVNALDAIAEKLDKMHRKEKPGCGKGNCGGSKKKPYDPPVELLGRLEAVALRLERYLTYEPRGWKKPIFTSRFALMYKKRYANMTQDEARKELKATKF